MVKWEAPKVVSKLVHVASDIVSKWVQRLGDNLNAIRDFTCKSLLPQSAIAACSATVSICISRSRTGASTGDISQEVHHPLPSGVVVCTIEERDEGVDFL